MGSATFKLGREEIVGYLKPNVYILFLGVASKGIPEAEARRLERKYGGKLFTEKTLPKGFKIEPAMMGDFFLTYKGQTMFRQFWFKEGKRWRPASSYEKARTPQESFKEHLKIKAFKRVLKDEQ